MADLTYEVSLSHLEAPHQTGVIHPWDFEYRDDLTTLGGPGSGNHGHAGRPGQVGGSSTEGFEAATSAEHHARMKELRIPPAWKHVRLNPDPNGALQAVGIDVKGRLQRKYSAEHSAEASAEKFSRLKDFNKVLPGLRERVLKDLNSGNLDTAEAARLIYLIDKTSFRIGSDKDTMAAKKAYGASTLEAKHVKIDGDKVRFKFTGKKGVAIKKTVEDAKLAEILTPRVEAGGRLFEPGRDSDVRRYMKEHAPEFTPKDFRTWHGTAQALGAIKKMKIPKDEKELKKARKIVGEQVAEFLGNTAAVSLASYIDPTAFAAWEKRRG